MLRLALPAVGQSLLLTMVFLADRVMLGRHSAEALASMQIAGPLVWTLQSVFGAFSAGTVASVGRSVGAKDPAGATQALRGSLLVSVAMGVAVGAVGYASIGLLLGVFGGGATPAVLAHARGFLSVMLPATPLVFVGVVTTNALQAAGDTRTPFAIAAFINLLNIALNSVLVFGGLGIPSLGARGAAIGSSIALGVEAALGLWALSRERSPVRWGALAPGVIGDAVVGARRVLAVAYGAMGERAVYHAGYLAYVRIINGLGPTAMATHQALLSIESVSFLSADGFAVAAGSLVSQRLGAGDVAGARRAGYVTAALSAAVLAVVAVVFLVAGGALIGVFRDDPAMVAMGVPALRAGAIAQVPMAVTIVLAQSLRASGATREAFGIALLGALGVRIAATWGLTEWAGLGLLGVWLGSGTDWCARMGLVLWRWSRGRWAKARV